MFILLHDSIYCISTYTMLSLDYKISKNQPDQQIIRSKTSYLTHIEQIIIIWTMIIYM